MSSPLVIRPYVAVDCTSLIAAIDQVCADTHFMATRRFEPTPAWDHALRQPTCPCHLLLVAAIGSQVIGWCRLFPTMDVGSPAVDLGIGVLAPARGRGIGSALLRRAQGWAWSQGLSAITLTTHPDNGGAIRFFRRCGFAPLLATDAHTLPMRWVVQPLPAKLSIARPAWVGEEASAQSLSAAS